MKELERMVNFHGEEVILYEDENNEIIAKLEGEAVKKFKSLDYAIGILYRAGFIL